MKKLLVLLGALLLSACGSSPTHIAPVTAESVAPVTDNRNEKMNDLVMYALSLADTPYRYGGNSPDNGFDCSGFVDHVFQHSLNIKLPRTSVELSKIGHWLPFSQIRAGDLVFYNTQKKPFSHVGIYVGEGKFVHAPKTGSQIRVENMSLPYWHSRYNGARRIHD